MPPRPDKGCADRSQWPGLCPALFSVTRWVGTSLEACMWGGGFMNREIWACLPEPQPRVEAGGTWGRVEEQVPCTHVIKDIQVVEGTLDWIGTCGTQQ